MLDFLYYIWPEWFYGEEVLSKQKAPIYLPDVFEEEAFSEPEENEEEDAKLDAELLKELIQSADDVKEKAVKTAKPVKTNVKEKVIKAPKPVKTDE